jgi:hypothetical protein
MIRLVCPNACRFTDPDPRRNFDTHCPVCGSAKVNSIPMDPEFHTGEEIAKALQEPAP